jgi:hypothetical protein
MHSPLAYLLENPWKLCQKFWSEEISEQKSDAQVLTNGGLFFLPP